MSLIFRSVLKCSRRLCVDVDRLTYPKAPPQLRKNLRIAIENLLRTRGMPYPSGSSVSDWTESWGPVFQTGWVHNESIEDDGILDGASRVGLFSGCCR